MRGVARGRPRWLRLPGSAFFLVFPAVWMPSARWSAQVRPGDWWFVMSTTENVVAAIRGRGGFAGDGGAVLPASAGGVAEIRDLRYRAFDGLVTLPYVTEADRENPEFRAYFEALDAFTAGGDFLDSLEEEAAAAVDAEREHASRERASVAAEARGGSPEKVKPWDAAAAERAAQIRAVRAADVARDMRRARKALKVAGDELAQSVRPRAVEAARTSAADALRAVAELEAAYAAHRVAVESVTALDRRAATLTPDRRTLDFRLSDVEAARAKAEGLLPAHWARIPAGGEGEVWQRIRKSVWPLEALDALAVPVKFSESVAVARVMPATGVAVSGSRAAHFTGGPW